MPTSAVTGTGNMHSSGKRRRAKKAAPALPREAYLRQRIRTEDDGTSVIEGLRPGSKVWEPVEEV